MENFEASDLSNENIENQQPVMPEAESQAAAAEETAYRGSGAGRKESPYANSPYVMQHPASEAPVREKKAAKPRKEKKTKGGFFRKLLAAVLSLAMVAGSCGLTAYLVNDYWEDRTNAMVNDFSKQIEGLQAQIDAASAANTGNSISGSPVAADGSLTPSQVYAKNVNSVVLIRAEMVSSAYGQSVTGYSTGSGFILSANGYILTNAHVVEGATSVVVTTYSGKEYKAEVCGADSTFIDLYLDVASQPDGTLELMDQDELDAALADGTITKEQYDLAERTGQMLVQGIPANIRRLEEFCVGMYDTLRREL